MNEHLSTFLACLVNPITDRFELGLKGIDAIVAYALDVQHLDATFPFLDPKRAMPAWPLAWNEVRSWAWAMADSSRGSAMHGHMVWRRDKGAFANRDDVGYPKRMEHVHIRGMVPEKNQE
jgi:hypothetical protein